MSSTERRSTRSRTPRDQGRRNIIDGTVSLLRTHAPDEITIRQIAEVSGHHHRMVQAWFGGKIPLFLAVHEQLNAEIAEALTPPLGRSGITEQARMSTVLMNWLIAADPTVFDGGGDTPVLDAVASIYESTYGLDPAQARMMAVRTVAGSITITLFPGPLGITERDTVELAQFETQLVELLAEANAQR